MPRDALKVVNVRVRDRASRPLQQVQRELRKHAIAAIYSSLVVAVKLAANKMRACSPEDSEWAAGLDGIAESLSATWDTHARVIEAENEGRGVWRNSAGKVVGIEVSRNGTLEVTP